MKKWMMLTMLFAVFLTACGGSGGTPEQTVSRALDAMKKADFKTAGQYFADNTGNQVNQMDGEAEGAKLLVNQLTYKIKETSVNGDQAVVKTEITNIDVTAVMGEYVKQAMAEALSSLGSDKQAAESDPDRLLTELLSKPDNKKVTTTVDVSLVKGEDGWKINGGETLLVAIIGGLANLGSNLAEAFSPSK